jgi:hypothetical protein
MVKIYTVPDNISDRVERWVTSSKIPWFYFSHTLGLDPKGQAEVNQNIYTIKDLPRFTHYFFPNSKSPVEDKSHIMPLIEWIKQELLPGYEVKRVMGNMTYQMSNAEMYLNLPHVDSNNESMYTFLYYVNSSDGKTVFFKNGLIDCETDPIKGTGVLFPSNTIHAGQVPSINKSRYVINIILGKRD